jgi:hypothetical protein
MNIDQHRWDLRMERGLQSASPCEILAGMNHRTLARTVEAG